MKRIRLVIGMIYNLVLLSVLGVISVALFISTGLDLLDNVINMSRGLSDSVFKYVCSTSLLLLITTITAAIGFLCIQTMYKISSNYISGLLFDVIKNNRSIIEKVDFDKEEEECDHMDSIIVEAELLTNCLDLLNDKITTKEDMDKLKEFLNTMDKKDDNTTTTES